MFSDSTHASHVVPDRPARAAVAAVVESFWLSGVEPLRKNPPTTHTFWSLSEAATLVAWATEAALFP